VQVPARRRFTADELDVEREEEIKNWSSQETKYTSYQRG